MNDLVPHLHGFTSNYTYGISAREFSLALQLSVLQWFARHLIYVYPTMQVRSQGGFPGCPKTPPRQKLWAGLLNAYALQLWVPLATCVG